MRPLITLEQFFKGSNGEASLWFNQYPPVAEGTDELAFWRSLRDREDVWDVLVSVTQYDFNDSPFDTESEWVYADVVVVISSASPEELLGVFPENAKPEFIGDNWDETGQEHERVFVPSGMRALFFWYD